MGIVLCPSCRVANMDISAICHCCAARLPFARVDAAQLSHRQLTQDAGADTACRTTREREARIAARAIQGAAWIMFIRGTLMPMLIRSSPQNGPFAGMDAHSIQLFSYCAGAIFMGLYFWARKDPLSAGVAALLLYAGLSYPDLANGSDWIAKGIISKLVMLSVLGRAVIAGIMHRITRDPDRG